MCNTDVKPEVVSKIAYEWFPWWWSSTGLNVSEIMM